MVAGALASLEEGRTYSYRDLSSRFGLAEADFVRALDGLIERRRVVPAIVDAGFGPAVLPSFEHGMRWRVAVRAR